MKKLNLLLSALLSGSILLSGCSLFPEEEEILAPPLKAPSSVTYTTTTVKRGDIVNSISMSGTFISTRTYDLSFDKRSGFLSEIYVKPGDTVEKGQLLAKLDTDALESEIQRQELITERARLVMESQSDAAPKNHSVELAEIEYQLQLLQLDALKNPSENAQKKENLLETAEKEKQDAEFRRQELMAERAELSFDTLKKKTYTPKATFRLSEIDYELQLLQLEQLKAQTEAEIEAGKLQDQLDAEARQREIKRQELATERARLALESAKEAQNSPGNAARFAEIDYQLQLLQLNQLKAELEKQSIYAPDSGTVSYMARTGVGEFVNARSTLIRLVDPNSLQIECTGDKIANLHLNQDVIVTIDKEKLAGKVVMSSADSPEIAEKSEKNFVRIAVPDMAADTDLLGKSVTVELIQEQKNNVLLIPRNVVSMYSGEAYVLVLENGVKKERVIETGIKNVTEIEVIDGLEEGEEVIIK